MNGQATQRQTAPRGLRPHIVLVGKCNAGKSALLNALTGHDLAIESPTRGTTTDPVSKASELVPFGPVVFVDTAGLDDAGELGPARGAKARRAVAGADVVLYVTDPARWDARDTEEIGRLVERGKSVMVVKTHLDRSPTTASTGNGDGDGTGTVNELPTFHVSSTEGTGVSELRDALVEHLSSARGAQKTLLEDLVRPFKLIMLIVPIDLEAPAGRLILPQVQTIREVLDADAATIVVKEREIAWALDQLKRPPDLAITDSQVVLKAAGSVPPEIPLTTFSILFSRFKGDLDLFVRNARRIDDLAHGSRVLITESCSHHVHCDDIGRVKIPRWMRQYTGKDISIDVVGGPLPEELHGYDLIVQCGGCMITRTQMLARLDEARSVDAPMTNYGVAISHMHGVLDRVLEPFALSR